MLNEFGEETSTVATDAEIGSMPMTRIAGEDEPSTPGSLRSGVQTRMFDLAAAKAADDKNEEAFAGMPTAELRKRLEYSRLEARARMMADAPDHFQDEEFGVIFKELNNRRFIADDKTLAAFDVIDGDGKVTNLSRLKDFLAFSDKLAAAKDLDDQQALLDDKFASPALKAWREAIALDAPNGYTEGADGAKFDAEGRAIATENRAKIAREYFDKNGRSWGDRVASLRGWVGNPNDWIEGTRDEWFSDSRAIREYEKVLQRDVLHAEAAKLMPYLTESQKNLVNIAASGADMDQFRGLFKAMKPQDREMMYSMCQAVRPVYDGNWLAEMGVRGYMGVRSALRSVRRADTGLTESLFNKLGITSDAELEQIRKGMVDDIHFAESVGDLQLKDPEGFVRKALEGYADSASMQYSMLGGEVLKRGGARVPGAWGNAMVAGGWALEGYTAASMIGEQFDNMLQRGVPLDRAAPMAVCGGLVDTYIETMNLKDWFGKSLTPAEMKRVGIRAGFRAALKLDGREFLRVLKTNAKQAVKIAASEVREELLQGANKEGWCELAEGRNILDSFTSSQTYNEGMNAFWEALPVCTAFGVFGAANPTGSVAKSANGAYAEHLANISGIVAKRKGMERVTKEQERYAEQVTMNEAARIVNATKGMSAKERNAWINAQEDLSLAEKQFYVEHCEMYAASVAHNGQAWADAHLSGSINEAMFAKAGWKFTHDENGNVNAITTANGETIPVNFVNREARLEDLTDKQVDELVAEYNRLNPDDKVSRDDAEKLAKAVSTVNGFYNDGKITLFGARATGATLAHESTHGLIERLSDVGTKEARKAVSALSSLVGGKKGRVSHEGEESIAYASEETARGVEIENEMQPGDEVSVKAIAQNIVTAVRKAVGLGKGRSFVPVIRTAEGKTYDPSEFLHDVIAKALAADQRRTELAAKQKAEMKAVREEKRQKKIEMRKEAALKAKQAAGEKWDEKGEEAKRILDQVDAEIAQEEQDAVDAVNRKYEAEFKLLEEQEAADEAAREEARKAQERMDERMLKNRKEALKNPPRLGHAKNQDGEAAQRARATYLVMWKAKTGKAVSQEEVDQLGEVYGLPPEALNLVKGKGGWRMSGKQILSDDALNKLADGLIRFWGDLKSVKIIVPDVVVGSEAEAANAVPNEVYDPVTDTFVQGRIVIDAANAKSLREQAGLEEPMVTPSEIEAARQRHPDTRFSLGKKAATRRKSGSKFSIGDRSAGNVAKFLLARDIIENHGRLPDTRRAQAVARGLGYNGSVAELLANAQAEAASQTSLLRYIASDPKTEKVLARAGLALRNERAIERARSAAIQFSREVSEAAEGTRKATQRAIRLMRGEDYEEMLAREGLDLNAILLAIRPKERNAAEPNGEAITVRPAVLSDAEREMVAKMAADAVKNGAERIAEAKKLIASRKDDDEKKGGKAEKAEGEKPGAETEGEDTAYGNAISAAFHKAIAEAGLTLDSPEAMVQLVKAVTEKYIKDYPNEFAGVDMADIWDSPLARAKFAANLASFAEAVAAAYAPSYARVRIASKAQLLNDKGLTTVRRIEEAGEGLFRDLHGDVIRQSREGLIKDIKRILRPHAKGYAENELKQDRTGVESALGKYCKFAYRAIKMSANEVEDRAKELEYALASWSGISEDEAERYRDFAEKKMELEMLDMFGNLKGRMPSELVALRDFVEQRVNESRWETMQFGEKWEQSREAGATAMADGIVGNPKKNGVMPDDDEAGGLYSLIGMMEVKARQLTRWCADAVRRDSSLKSFSMVEEMIQRAYDIQFNYMQMEKAKFVDLCKSVYGGESKAAQALHTDIDPSLWSKLDRGGQKTKWTVGRLLQMYVSCVQSDYAENCAKYGRDAEYVRFLEETINSLNPKHMDFVNGLRGMYLEQGDALSEVLERTTGTRLRTPNRLYMPVQMNRGHNLAATTRVRAYLPFARSLTPRVKNGLDFDQGADILDIWHERLEDAAHTIAWADTGSMVQGICQSDRVLRAIRQAHGKKVMNQWNNYILDILAGAQRPNEGNDWGVAAMRFCARLAARTWLMLNPASWAKQLAAIPCFALSQDGNLGDVVKSLAFCALHPKRAAMVMKDLSETSAFRARYGVAISQEMKYATSSDGKFKTWIDKMVDLGMSGTTRFDKLGVYALALVYHNRRCTLESQGMSAREASETAASWLMHIVDKTAQTTRTVNTTELQRAGGAWGILLQFKSAPAQQTQFELGAIQEALAVPTDAKRWKKAAACVLINHLIVPTFNTAIESVLSCLTSWGIPDEDKRDRLIELWIANIISGSLGSIFFLGTVIEGAGGIVGKVATGNEVNTYDLRNSLGRQIPAAEMLNLWVNHGDKAIKAFAELTDGDIQEGAYEMAKALLSLVPGTSWVARKGFKAYESATEK